MADELADASADDALLTAFDGDAAGSELEGDAPQGADDVEFEDDEDDEDDDGDA